ncbi:hypothetical protein RFI_13852 [Reticulomyxa filosa]|uniref:Uncharacterized protein n=1 Tax=Reticulomyxa filosa TaxID=46433 RepID=X6NBR0_RETFI|nr:hypothetical protein RFI_13852 [Reticulomyxa filosa]|eukprot:ETO23328.1 hypothetical protein RFI_13852 [Reticulomyxa filosa]
MTTKIAVLYMTLMPTACVFLFGIFIMCVEIAKFSFLPFFLQQLDPGYNYQVTLYKPLFAWLLSAPNKFDYHLRLAVANYVFMKNYVTDNALSLQKNFVMWILQPKKKEVKRPKDEASQGVPLVVNSNFNQIISRTTLKQVQPPQLQLEPQSQPTQVQSRPSQIGTDLQLQLQNQLQPQLQLESQSQPQSQPQIQSESQPQPQPQSESQPQLQSRSSAHDNINTHIQNVNVNTIPAQMQISENFQNRMPMETSALSTDIALEDTINPYIHDLYPVEKLDYNSAEKEMSFGYAHLFAVRPKDLRHFGEMSLRFFIQQYFGITILLFEDLRGEQR